MFTIHHITFIFRYLAIVTVTYESPFTTELLVLATHSFSNSIVMPELNFHPVGGMAGL